MENICVKDWWTFLSGDDDQLAQTMTDGLADMTQKHAGNRDPTPPIARLSLLLPPRPRHHPRLIQERRIARIRQLHGGIKAIRPLWPRLDPNTSTQGTLVHPPGNSASDASRASNFRCEDRYASVMPPPPAVTTSIALLLVIAPLSGRVIRTPTCWPAPYCPLASSEKLCVETQ